MDTESARRYCLSLPHVTEDIQWDNDLLFRIGGKMFVVMGLDEAGANRISFRCPPETYAELIERPGIIPAPYLARYHWVALQSWDALGTNELRDLIRGSWELVRDKLPKKIRAELQSQLPKSKPKNAGKSTRRK